MHGQQNIKICLISISCTAWRWPLSSAETCSCTLCGKYFIFYQ